MTAVQTHEQAAVEQDHDGKIEQSIHQNEEGAESGEGHGQGPSAERLVPVNEAIRYRKRAQQAEQQLAGFKHRVEQLERQLSDANESMDRLERRQRIEAELAEQEANDLEAARLLTEAALAQMSEPDVSAAVSDLRRHRPWLFGPDGWGDASALGPAPDEPTDPLTQAHEQARQSGDRRDLLRYLRLRRKA